MSALPTSEAAHVMRSCRARRAGSEAFGVTMDFSLYRKLHRSHTRQRLRALCHRSRIAAVTRLETRARESPCSLRTREGRGLPSRDVRPHSPRQPVRDRSGSRRRPRRPVRARAGFQCCPLETARARRGSELDLEKPREVVADLLVRLEEPNPLSLPSTVASIVHRRRLVRTGGLLSHASGSTSAPSTLAPPSR